MKIMYIGADKEVNNPVIGTVTRNTEIDVTDDQWEQIKSNGNFVKVSSKRERNKENSGGNE